MTTAMLEVDGVTKRFGRLVALRDVSFRASGGEVLGLIGPNGAGKTTLVKVLGGALDRWGGDVRFEGRSVKGLRPFRIARLGIAGTFQITEPFIGLSTVENAMVGALYGRERPPPRPRRAREEAAEVLATVGLQDKAEEPVDSLNLPERKRLELARVLSMRPRLLLLDEIMAGMSPHDVDQTASLIRMIREQGVGVLLIEHVMQAIAQLADRVLVLHDGEVLVEGSPTEVFANERVIDAYLGARPVSSEPDDGHDDPKEG